MIKYFKMLTKIIILAFISAAVAINDGWIESEKAGTYIGEIKNCSAPSYGDDVPCYISIWFNIGEGVVRGGYGGSYIINTYSAARFVKETTHLVKPPTNGDVLSAKFVPWMNCGLTTIDVSMGTPDEAMESFKVIAHGLKCDFFDTDDELSSGNSIKQYSLLILLILMISKGI